jgi:RNA polymerase-associated protein LEO1
MASNSEDEVMGNVSDLDDDLFGDEAEEEPPKPRELSDEELDSGDDEGRDDRLPEKEIAEEHDEDSTRDARILEADIFRHPIPKPSDGQVINWFSVQERNANSRPVQYLAPT